MVMEEDQTLNDDYTIQYADDVSQNSTLKTYIILLANVAPINIILKRMKNISYEFFHNYKNICYIIRDYQ